MIKNGPKTGQL